MTMIDVTLSFDEVLLDEFYSAIPLRPGEQLQITAVTSREIKIARVKEFLKAQIGQTLMRYRLQQMKAATRDDTTNRIK